MGIIYLTGMMGSGKTVVARLVAEQCARTMIDIDERIIDREGASISEIFAKKGEPYFRRIEKEILQDISRRDNCVVATGGGVVLDPANIACMQKSGVIIYLKAPTDVLYMRLKDKKDRPLLKVQNPEDRLKEILKARSGFYEKADYAVDTAGKTPHMVADDIVAMLRLEGRL